MFTRSNPTNLLLQAALEVVEEKNEDSQLRQLLGERKADLKKSRDDFLKRMNSGRPRERFFAAELAAVAEGLNDYEAALDEMQKYFSQKDTAHLKYGVPRLIDAANKLLSAMSNLDAQYYSGPSPFPQINLLNRLFEDLKNDPAIGDEILLYLQSLEAMFRRSLDNLKNLPPPEPRSRKTLETAYRSTLDCLAEIKISLPQGEAGNLSNGLIRLENDLQKIDDAFKEQRQELFFARPTQSPYVNLVLNAIEGTRRGNFSPDILPEASKILAGEYRQVRSGFASSAGVPETQIARQEPFSLMEEALELLARYQTEPEALLLDKSKALLTEAAEQFFALNRFEGVITEIFCAQCGRLNPPNQRNCLQCGQPFPEPDEDPNSSTFQIAEGQESEWALGGVPLTENFKKILETVDDMYQEKITPREFTAVLNWMESLLQQAAHELQGVSAIRPEKYPHQAEAQAQSAKETVDSVKNLLSCGLETARQGLDILKNYLPEKNREYLVEGLKTFWQGAREITQAQRFSQNLITAEEE